MLELMPTVIDNSSTHYAQWHRGILHALCRLGFLSSTLYVLPRVTVLRQYNHYAERLPSRPNIYLLYNHDDLLQVFTQHHPDRDSLLYPF